MFVQNRYVLNKHMTYVQGRVEGMRGVKEVLEKRDTPRYIFCAHHMHTISYPHIALAKHKLHSPD